MTMTDDARITGRREAAVAGLIFDMDGTLVDNMGFHNDAWRLWHEERSLAFDRDTFFAHSAGRANFELIGEVMPDTSREEREALAAEKDAIYRRTYEEHMAPLAGLVAFLERWQAAGRPMAVATAAGQENAAFILDGLGLRRFFSACLMPSMGYRGKPFPDLFLAASTAMGVAPDRCIVFEDAPLGIEAARRAGMRAIGVTTMLDAGRFDAPNVVATIADYTDSRLPGLVDLS